MPRPTRPTRLEHRFFVMGCTLAGVTALLILWAFFDPEGVTPSRRYLLNFLLPLFAGFTSACFIGSIRIRETIASSGKMLPVSAGAGFAVWLITLLSLIENPDLLPVVQPDPGSEEWKSANDYDDYFQRQRAGNLYPKRQEGRVLNGIEVYRGVWERLPAETCFDSRTGQTDAQYASHKEQMMRRGFRLVSESQFKDTNGDTRHQVTWLRASHGEGPRACD